MNQEPTQSQKTLLSDHTNCNDNSLILRKINPFPFEISIEVDFTPVSIASESIEKKIEIKPVFNKDAKYYTPSFILELDKNKITRTDEYHFNQYLEKKNQVSQEKTDLFVPQPSKANRLCYICRQPFDDYLTHVNRPSHRKLLRQCQFQKSIIEICGQTNSGEKIMEEGQNGRKKEKVKRAKKERGRKQSRKTVELKCA